MSRECCKSCLSCHQFLQRLNAGFTPPRHQPDVQKCSSSSSSVVSTSTKMTMIVTTNSRSFVMVNLVIDNYFQSVVGVVHTCMSWDNNM